MSGDAAQDDEDEIDDLWERRPYAQRWYPELENHEEESNDP